MQALVYTFIALAAVAIGALAYFALAFTPANAVLVAVVFGSAAVVLMERRLRVRAESRLEKAIQDLSRLLATDAQAGSVLGQRINAIADLNPGERLETVEADISVLGTVIRQVAEAVAELEDKLDRANAAGDTKPAPERMIAAPAPSPAPASEPEPVIPLEMLRQALEENRLVHHIQPIVKLPQRRPIGYDLLPRLALEEGELADAADFMPRKGGKDAIRHIEWSGLTEAVTIARRSRTGGQPATLYIPLSRATLGDTEASEQVLATLDANRAIAPGLIFLVDDDEWRGFSAAERKVAEAMARKGAGFSLARMRSLRVDIADLSALGVRSLRVDAARFLQTPERYTDFHITDIAAYLERFEVSLLATGVQTERQIIELLDNDVVLVKGDFIAAPGPVRPDLALEPMRSVTPRLRQAEA